MKDLNTGELFNELIGIIRKLRSEDGCPWDREQSIESLRSNILEECWELIDAINNADMENLAEELGDMFLVLGLIAYINEQDGNKSINSILKNLNSKLIRRHPHVFDRNTARITESEASLDAWHKLKQNTEGRKSVLLMEQVPKGIPALSKAYKLQKRGARVGFDWESTEGILAKINEEIIEFIESKELSTTEQELELGDILFSVANLARFHKIDPELALERANNKFRTRFNFIEIKMKERGLDLTKEQLELMEELWEEAKKEEAPPRGAS